MFASIAERYGGCGLADRALGRGAALADAGQGGFVEAATVAHEPTLARPEVGRGHALGARVGLLGVGGTTGRKASEKEKCSEA